MYVYGNALYTGVIFSRIYFQYLHFKAVGWVSNTNDLQVSKFGDFIKLMTFAAMVRLHALHVCVILLRCDLTAGSRVQDGLGLLLIVG